MEKIVWNFEIDARAMAKVWPFQLLLIGFNWTGLNIP